MDRFQSFSYVLDLSIDVIHVVSDCFLEDVHKKTVTLPNFSLQKNICAQKCFVIAKFRSYVLLCNIVQAQCLTDYFRLLVPAFIMVLIRSKKISE